jgi:hypothetical protein
MHDTYTQGAYPQGRSTPQREAVLYGGRNFYKKTKNKETAQHLETLRRPFTARRLVVGGQGVGGQDLEGQEAWGQGGRQTIWEVRWDGKGGKGRG